MSRPLQNRRIFSQIHVLIIPSTWEETFSRIALEAHLVKIPIISTNRGNLANMVHKKYHVEPSAEGWTTYGMKIIKNCRSEDYILTKYAIDCIKNNGHNRLTAKIFED